MLAVIDRIAAAGLRYCPHYLGAGIGLLASAHVLAARGAADGWLEVDANENPLRTLLCPPLATLAAAGSRCRRRPGSASSPTSRPCARSAPERAIRGDSADGERADEGSAFAGKADFHERSRDHGLDQSPTSPKTTAKT